jgi:hypothetical protein
MPSWRQSLSHANESRWKRSGVPPFTLAVAIAEVEGERARVGVEIAAHHADDFTVVQQHVQ